MKIIKWWIFRTDREAYVGLDKSCTLFWRRNNNADNANGQLIIYQNPQICYIRDYDLQINILSFISLSL